MPRQKNDGKGRMGGRAKGTPNKVNSSVKEWLAGLIDRNRSKVENDIDALEPRERLQILEKLMQYVIPKQQAVSASVDIETLSDEQVDAIVERLTRGIDLDGKGGASCG